MEQYATKAWVDLLPIAMFNLNTSKSSTTKCMPFEITFNKKPNLGSIKNFKELNEKNELVEVSVSAESIPTTSRATSNEEETIEERDETAP